MASSSICPMETWEDEQMDDLQGMEKQQMDDFLMIATYACESAKTFGDRYGKTDYERFHLLDFCQRKILEEIQCEIDKLVRLNDELRNKDPRKYRRQLISKEEEAAFWKELESSKQEVKFIDELFECNKLKYNSPPAAIDAKAKGLCEKYPLVSERARKLVKDHVRRLLQLHEAAETFRLHKLFLSIPAITERSSFSDDLKLFEGSNDFVIFTKAEMHNELRAYKRFLLDHDGKVKAQEYMKYVKDSRVRNTNLCEKKPYDYENSILNLAAKVVHRAYVIDDVKEEIIRLQRF